MVDDYNLYHRAPDMERLKIISLNPSIRRPHRWPEGRRDAPGVARAERLSVPVRPHSRRRRFDSLLICDFRTDHQTFRKLPRSRGIIFGVHPILRRLEEFADSPMVPALLATVHEKSDADLMKYKLAHMCEPLI